MGRVFTVEGVVVLVGYCEIENLVDIITVLLIQ